VQLLGEEVNTEVTVLASLRRGGDADDLARAALQDQEIANADVVARDSDGVRRRHGFGGEGACADERDRSRWGGRSRSRGEGRSRGGVAEVLNWDTDANAGGGRSLGGGGEGFLDYNFLAVVVLFGVRVVVMVLGTVDRVEDAIGSFVKTVAK